MGGVPWMYFVPYERDVQDALDRLKAREFHAGRYYPVIDTVPYLLDDAGPTPGAAHPSIEAARAAAAETGTRSILDMDRVATESRSPGSLHTLLMAMGARMVEGGEAFSEDELQSAMGFGVITPVSRETLRRLYGTDTPTRAMVTEAHDFLEGVERGTGVYVVVHDGAAPTDICFAGYSFD